MAQEAANQAYISARNAYSKVTETLRPGEVELADLLALTAGLPDGPMPAKPVTVTNYTTKRYFAYSRTGRKNALGGTELHDISVTSGVAKCNCPGFLHHGHCWASDEALVQSQSSIRRSGTNGVYKR